MNEDTTAIETGLTATETDEGTEQTTAPIDGAKSEIEAEIEKRVQSEVDKKLGQALKTREENLKRKFEEEKAEAERLAKLSEKERQEAIDKKQREDFARERAEFESYKRELETVKILTERKIPIEFASYLMGSDMEQTQLNIDKFEGLLIKQIKAAVEERFKGIAQPERVQQQGTDNAPVKGKSVLDTLRNL